MRKILAEWRKYLAEQAPTKEPRPKAGAADDDLLGMEDVPEADPELVKKYERWRDLQRKKVHTAVNQARWEARRKKRQALAMKRLKSKLGPLVEKARKHVINLLPHANNENRRRTAALLGKYFNPQLPKELKLTKKELLVLTDMLGWAQYNQIIKIPIEMLDRANWSKWWRFFPKGAGGIYNPALNKIWINWESSSPGFVDQEVEEVWSTLTHELWHAVDHTDIRGSGWLAQTAYGAKLPRRKKAAIKKIISKKFPAKWKFSVSWHGYSEHVSPTGFMSVLNRAEMDKLMSAKTYVRGYDKPASWDPWHRDDLKTADGYQKYCKEGTERYARLKNLQTLFQKLNHPDSMSVTADDMYDFCAHTDKYSSYDSGIKCLIKGFKLCKKHKQIEREGGAPVRPDDPGFEDVAATLNRVAKLEMPAVPRRGPRPEERGLAERKTPRQ